MDGVTLVTGSTGFVGRQVTKLLLKNDSNKIRIAVRCRNELVDQWINKGCDVLYIDDVFDISPIFTDRLFRNVEKVIHFAWYANPSDYLFSEKNFHCMLGTLRLAELAKSHGVEKFVGIGTCLEYEPSNNRHSVNSKLNAVSPYASAKLATYFLLKNCFADGSVKFCWCRIFFLYGEHEHEQRLTPYIHRQLSLNEPVTLGDPDATRDFMDVKDAARLLLDVLFYESSGAFNICSGVGQTVRQYSTEIAEKYGKGHLLNFGNQKASNPSVKYVVGVPLDGK